VPAGAPSPSDSVAACEGAPATWRLRKHAQANMSAVPN
jgi:hypothetical protein